jgi:hypothetical protein
MQTPPKSAEISSAAIAGVAAEYGNSVQIKDASSAQFTPAMMRFFRKLDPLMHDAVERMGQEMMISVVLSVTVAHLRSGLSAEDTAFVLRAFADSQMGYYNEGDGSDGR